MKNLCAVLMLMMFCGCGNAETRARFIFIGDIMVHDQQLDAAKRKGGTYDFSPSFRRIKPLLKDAFLVGNLETVFAGTGKKLKYAGFPLFNTPDVFTENLTGDLEVDLLSLANNHIFDRGASGARRTTEVLDSADIAWIGLGVGDIPSNDAILLENNGVRVAFINHSYGSNEWPKPSDVHLNVISEADIEQSMARAKSLSPDVIIALFHWGNEYHHNPNVHQKKAADTAFTNGASLIVGTHPHVLQPVEVRIESDEVRAVAWSLGNFVSFQRTLPRERSVILSAEFVKDDDGTRLAGLGIAPLYVIAPGSKRTEVTYAGNDETLIEALDFSGLSKSQIINLRSIGRSVIEFLGARKETDEYGFNILWREESPDVLPKSRKKSP
ncbi:MAG: CapA family protein [Synergistaceae bacterium]|nr:CapA family protein [Synergistaceae bacterium]MBQ3397393.1 CapA family protein [Synergistaceae bacterium]MBQ6115134.1 CapA family protein [Synergistaceae bacterium]MBR0247759.1 CapA family protein [Synergistaceae bacterium]